MAKENPKPRGKGWKRDRMFISKEEHEQKYAKKRKKPAKIYKIREEKLGGDKNNT